MPTLEDTYGKLTDEERKVLGVGEEATHVRGLIEASQEGQAYVASIVGDGSKLKTGRKIGVTMDAIKRRNERMIERQQSGFRYETILQMVNSLDDKENRGALKSAIQVRKILAEHYHAEKPPSKEEAYFEYAGRMGVLKAYERDVEQFTRYKNKVVAMAFKKNAKGEEIMVVDPLKMTLMFEKLGKLREFVINANNWNMSLRNQLQAQTNNTVNIFAQADREEIADPLKALGDGYTKRLSLVREMRAAKARGEAVEGEEVEKSQHIGV